MLWRYQRRARLAAIVINIHPNTTSTVPLTVLGMAACYTPYAYTVLTLRTLGVSQKAMVVMLFVYGLGAVIGNLVSGYATDRWSPTRALTITYIVMVLTLAGLGGIAVNGSFRVLVPPLMLLWGASSWAQTSAQQHRLIAAAPLESSLVISLNSSAIYLGIGLGAVLGGVALPAGAATIFGVGCGVAVLALLFLRMTLSEPSQTKTPRTS